MNATAHIEQDALALYAMQLMSPSEMAAAKAHVDGCAECRSEVAAIQGDLAAYACTVEMETPAAATRERLLRQVSREKKVVSISQDSALAAAVPVRRARPAAGVRILPWVGWAMAAGLALATVNLYREREALHGTVATQNAQLAEVSSRAQLASNAAAQASSAAAQAKDVAAHAQDAAAASSSAAAVAASHAEQASREKDQVAREKEQVARGAAQVAAEAARARLVLDTITDQKALRVTLTRPKTNAVPLGRATYLADKGSLVFIASNMAPLQLQKIYELWLMPADGGAPIPAGTFRPDARGNASVILPNLPRGVEAKGFGVTIEAEGGSTKPTLPIIMAGT